jgi:D-lactate dehydrogenase
LYGLEKGILAGAGIDVLEGENAIQEERQILDNHCLDHASFKTLYFDHVLMGRENVIITPHNAFNSTEALHLILDVTAENLLAFQQQKPQNTLELRV